MVKSNGFVIAIEGIDGSGKSTVAKGIKEFLESKNIKSYLLESGGLPGKSIAKQIKRITHDPKNKNLAPTTETFLYLARLSQRVQEYVIPNLREKKVVLVDRFIMSVFVLARYGRFQERGLILKNIGFASQGVTPILTILCDLDEEVAKARIVSTGEGLSRKESEGVALLKRLRNGFLLEARYLKKKGENIFILRTDKLSKEKMLNEAKKIVERIL